MWIYIVNIVLIIVFALLIKNKKHFVIVISIQLFLLLALRSTEIGVDWTNYKAGYYYIKNLNFHEIITKLHFLKSASLAYPYNYESGYALMCWIVSHCGFSYHFFLVICAAINIGTFGKFIYRYSEIPWLSFIILCTFQTYEYFFGIIRQSLALCLFIIALMKLLDKKNKTAYIFFILAFLFHRASVILFPIAFFVNRQNVTKKGYILSLILTLPFILLSNFLYSKVFYIIMDYFGKGGYVGHEIQMNNQILLLFIVAIITAFFVNFNKCKGEKIFNVLIVSLILSIYFEIIGMYNDVLARSVQMLLSFLILLIPYIIKIYEKEKIILLVKMVMTILLIVFMMTSYPKSKIVPYKIEEKNILFD